MKIDTQTVIALSENELRDAVRNYLVLTMVGEGIPGDASIRMTDTTGELMTGMVVSFNSSK